MNITNMLALLQISDAENPTIFPFPFQMHLSLAVISLLFFGYRFAVQKKPFQLIFAIAVPLSMLVWVSDNKTLFYILGLVELALITIAIITSITCKPKKTAEASDKNNSKEE